MFDPPRSIASVRELELVVSTFVEELEEMMAEDGWQQVITLEDDEPAILKKILKYLKHVRWERDGENYPHAST